MFALFSRFVSVPCISSRQIYIFFLWLLWNLWLRLICLSILFCFVYGLPPLSLTLPICDTCKNNKWNVYLYRSSYYLSVFFKPTCSVKTSESTPDAFTKGILGWMLSEVTGMSNMPTVASGKWHTQLMCLSFVLNPDCAHVKTNVHPFSRWRKREITVHTWQKIEQKTFVGHC